MSSTINYTAYRDNDVIIAVNAIIQKGIAAGTMSDNDADILRDLLIRIKQDAKLIAAYANLRNSISGLISPCVRNASIVSSVDDLSDDDTSADL